MMKYFFIVIIILIFGNKISAQNEQDSIQKLNEVIIESQRLSLPFTENSHTIAIINNLKISLLTATSVDELLQNIIGVDVRRRGIEGMQSDLYIRGGNFEQVLLLIDGVKMDDLQTGHHTMNGIISPENIERIEVIKGAASRIYGQNAMNGVINIITKRPKEDQAITSINVGSYETIGASFNYQKVMETAAIQFGINKLQSEGYRYNTDFENWNGFFKMDFSNYQLLGTYSERKFGANGFYASPSYKDQYEETETHLLSLKRKWNVNRWNLTAKTYWRRNQDMYLLVRSNPNLYRNMHINNKIGASLDASFTCPGGTTGIGFDINQGYLRSNNLGDRSRFSASMYLEHRFQFFEDKLDITPGVALTYYSDFKSFAYPGIDIGYKINKDWKIYFNSGLTSRIPTYTNLYYNSAAEQGNPNLKPEKAFTSEAGFYFTENNLILNAVYFYRTISNLIDWTKFNPSDKWNAKNINQVNTNGLETSMDYSLKIRNLTQNLKLGYTYMEEKVSKNELELSRYELNNFKHQLSLGLQTKFCEILAQNFNYRYIERATNSNYHIFDAGFSIELDKWKLIVSFNNLFDIKYTETNLVPMPMFNMSGKIIYKF